MVIGLIPRNHGFLVTLALVILVADCLTVASSLSHADASRTQEKNSDFPQASQSSGLLDAYFESVAAKQEHYQRAHLRGADEDVLSAIRKYGLDYDVGESGEYIVTAATSVIQAMLRETGVNGLVVDQDVGATLYARSASQQEGHFQTLNFDALSSGSMGGHQTLEEIREFALELHKAHPNTVSPPLAIGCTFLKTTTFAIRLSALPECDPGTTACPKLYPAFPDNDVSVTKACTFNSTLTDVIPESRTESDSTRAPRIVFTAAHHSREPAGISNLFYFARSLAQDYDSNTPEAVHLLSTREIWLLPVVNPDGYSYNNFYYKRYKKFGLQRKNMRPPPAGTKCSGQAYVSMPGIDINRNYGYEWGRDNEGSSPDPCDDAYRGASAFSEPETQTVRDFIAALAPDLVLNYHTFGGYIFYPYGYAHATKKKAVPARDQEVMSHYAFDLQRENHYKTGTADSILYVVNGESSDYFYGAHQIITFTIEAGTDADDFYPAASRIIPIAKTNMPIVTYLSWMIDSYYNTSDISYAFGEDQVLEVKGKLRNTGLRDAPTDVRVTFTPKQPWNKYVDVVASARESRILGDHTQMNLQAGGTSNSSLIWSVPKASLKSRSPSVNFHLRIAFKDTPEPGKLFTDDMINKILNIDWKLEAHDDRHDKHPFEHIDQQTFISNACGPTSCSSTPESHARCDYVNQRCTCMSGYYGKDCEKSDNAVPPPPPFNALNVILLILAVSVILLGAIYSVRWVIKYRKRRGGAQFSQVETV